MKTLITAALMCSAAAFGQTEQSSKQGFVRLNSEMSYKLMEPNQNLRKVLILAEEFKKDTTTKASLTIGTSLIALADYQASNTDSKFAYLMRHPTSSNQIGKEVSELVLHSFQLSTTGRVTNWLGVHAEILYNPEQSFGTGIITDLKRNQLQLRKGFVYFGDLNKFPVYGAIGKMDAPFGQMGSVSPFTNSTIWHAFGGLGYGAQASFKKWGLHVTAMAIQGGSQFRGLSTPVGDSTNVPSIVNNFVGDINYTLNAGENFSIMLGGSYMHGSTYAHSFPVMHFDPTKDNNPAYTAYGKVELYDRIIVKGGYAQTLQVWPGTHNPSPPLDIYAASKVSSIDVGGKYSFKQKKNMGYAISGEFSNFTAGPKGSPWERQNQYILGFSAMYKRSSKLFLELFRTDGYVPLNFISGSDPNAPFPAGTTHSERGVITYGIVLGAQITL
jgi:hypothetical protein